jgi:hypothetical protein
MICAKGFYALEAVRFRVSPARRIVQLAKIEQTTKIGGAARFDLLANQRLQ